MEPIEGAEPVPDDDAPIERPRWIYVGAVLCLVASLLLILLTIA